MSGDYEEDVCRSALRLVQELCFAPRARPPHDKCLEFTDLLRHRGHPRPSDGEVSVSLLSVIVTFCGIVLLGVSLFVSWKLCWVPWRHKGGPGGAPRKEPPQGGGGAFGDPLPERGEPGPEPPPERCYLDMGPCPEGGGRALGPPPASGDPLGAPPGPPRAGGGGDGDPAQRPLPAARGWQ
ncbi:synaptotagmin-3-like, partial [Phalacrocorax carbo]|uniref:synaptotagmin-3-like n=1 Tax=Phalacrocorax carbo TaxID=9209 RepID=UPI003119D7C6